MKTKNAEAVYRAGTSIGEARARSGLSTITKLSSNENPLGASRLAHEAIVAAMCGLHRYPDAGDAKEAIAKHANTSSQRVLLGNGSTQLIELILRALCEPGDGVLLFEKTFIYYRVAAQQLGLSLSEAKRGSAFSYDVDALLGALTPQTRVVFIASPDNPTGVYLSKDSLERILAALPERVLLVLDEAYREYVPAGEYFDPTLMQEQRLLVLRTFSKIYGLAGLRCGYVIGAPTMIEVLARAQAPFTVNGLASAAVIAALQDSEHLRLSQQLNASGMELLRGSLNAERISFVGSYGNFLMINTPMPGEELYQALLRRGVIVRALGEYGLHNFIRVTIGLAEENQRFLELFLAATHSWRDNGAADRWLGARVG